MIFRCPHCGGEKVGGVELLGQLVSCVGCGAQFPIPAQLPFDTKSARFPSGIIWGVLAPWLFISLAGAYHGLFVGGLSFAFDLGGSGESHNDELIPPSLKEGLTLAWVGPLLFLMLAPVQSLALTFAGGVAGYLIARIVTYLRTHQAKPNESNSNADG